MIKFETAVHTTWAAVYISSDSIIIGIPLQEAYDEAFNLCILLFFILQAAAIIHWPAYRNEIELLSNTLSSKDSLQDLQRILF